MMLTTLSKRLYTVILAVGIAAAGFAASDEEPKEVKEEQQQELGDLSLRDLLGVEISSASRKLEPLSRASAAIYVITQDDIRRLGATNVPEALRIVPGLHVARIDANKWSISSRGFDGQFSNKLLVMIDCRTIYTPLFSGVYWDAHDMVMEDIDRIEVIRGPGAALWGANAVNGVINVITKSSSDTEGLMVSAGGGSQDGYGALRYGGRPSESLSYRVSARYTNRASQVTRDGGEALDAWDMFTAGVRLDWTRDADNLMVVGSVYNGSLDTGLNEVLLTPPFIETVLSENQTSGLNVLSRWNHAFGVGNDLVFQAYYDRYDRNEPSFYVEQRDTFDFEMQHGFVAGRHDLLWGGRYRFSTDDLPSTGTVRWTPRSRDDQLYSLFAQDRIGIAGEAARLTFGTKFEHNDYTGFELQPNVRFAWMPGDHTVWGSVSRAVRTPARFEHTFEINSAAIPTPGGGLGLLFIQGNPQSVAEEVIDYEVGYRVQPSEIFSVDITGFYDDYDQLTSIEPVGPPTFTVVPFPHVEIRQAIDNLALGTGYGTEVSANVLPVESWRLGFSYAYLKLELSTLEGGADRTAVDASGNFPQNQFRIQSFYDISRAFELDAFLHYVDELPTQETPSYTRFDVRFAWQPTERVELAVMGQNLLDERHLEYANLNNPASSSFVPRSVLVQVRWNSR